eukprot:jgi/Tetstr1/449511/TSEL_036599.t1
MRTSVTKGARVSPCRGHMLIPSGDQRRCQHAQLFGNVTESVGDGNWRVRWDHAPADVQEPDQTLRREQATDGRTPPSAASAPRGQVTAVGPFVPPRPAAAANASASALGGSRVTCNVVPDTRTHTEIPSILANSSPASIPATEPLPADNLDMSAESQGSQPGLEGDMAPSRPAGHRLAIAPKRYLDTNGQHAPGNHGRYANGRSKQ